MRFNSTAFLIGALAYYVIKWLACDGVEQMKRFFKKVFGRKN